MNPTDLSPLQSDPLAAAALAQIAAGKWRKARDLAKDLFKKDRARYLPLLLAANAGLAEEMLDRGLTQDAATVIAYLKTIAPPVVIQELEARMRRKKAAAVLEKGSPAEVLSTAWQMVSTAPAGPPSKELLKAADRLVVTEVLPPGDDAPELRGELNAVRLAVKATGNGAWEEAKTALRGIPAQSLFGSWRLFLRGVRCVHTGEMEAARQCFNALPPGSATARAAWTYRQVCGLPVTADQPPGPARIAFPAALGGASQRAASAIMEAEPLWRKKNIFGAYTTLVAGYGRGEFPSDKPGLAGSLSDLFLTSRFRGFQLSDELFSDFVDALENRIDKPGALPPLEEKAILLQLLRLDGAHLLEQDVLDYAERAVELDAKMHGPQPLRAAAIWELAASQLRTDGEPAPSFFGPPTLPIKERTHALRRCMELDPGHAPRTMALAEHLKSHDEGEELKTLLEQALKTFPEHPGLIALAGLSALETSPADALPLLRQAVRLDPGNREAADALFTSLQRQADSSRTFDAALWDEMVPLSRPTPGQLPDSPESLGLAQLRWFLKLRRVLGDPQTARSGSAIDAALALAPSPWVGNLAISMLSGSPPSARRDGAASSKNGGRPTWQDLYWAIQLMQWRLLRGSDPAWLESMEAFLNAEASELISIGELVQPENAKAVLAWARAVWTIVDLGEPARDKALPCQFILSVAESLENRIVLTRNYEAELASILLPASCPAFGLPCCCDSLGLIHQAARNRGDTASAALASRLLSQCGDFPIPPWTRVIKKGRKKTAPAKKSPAKKAAAKKAAVWMPPSPADEGATAKKVPAKKAASAKKSASRKAAPQDPLFDLIERLTQSKDPAIMDLIKSLEQPDLFD